MYILIGATNAKYKNEPKWEKKEKNLENKKDSKRKKTSNFKKNLVEALTVQKKFNTTFPGYHIARNRFKQTQKLRWKISTDQIKSFNLEHER